MKIYIYEYFLNKKFKNWDSNKYNWKTGSWLLIRYCSEYFNIWWDPKRFDWTDEPKYLNIYCSEYKYIWYKDYIIWKLQQ